MVRLINNNCVDFIVGDCRGPAFRTAFMSIGGLRALTDAPFMALSASAPPSIMKIIEESLQLKSPVHIRHSLDRPNIFLSCAKSKSLAVSYRLCFGLLGVVLHYCLHPKRDLAGVAAMLGKAKEVPEEVPKTIIFCRTKNDCAKVYSFLCKSLPRNTVSMYHSSISQSTRSTVQEQFRCSGQLRCLSATIAFGMVINLEVHVQHV